MCAAGTLEQRLSSGYWPEKPPDTTPSASGCERHSRDGSIGCSPSSSASVIVGKGGEYGASCDLSRPEPTCGACTLCATATRRPGMPFIDAATCRARASDQPPCV